MSATADTYTPGRSLLAEMTGFREQMTNLRAPMLQWIDLQREANRKLDTALNNHPTNGDVASAASQVV